MGPNKWRKFESAILIVPFIFLLLYVLKLPLSLPAAILPEWSYMAWSRGMDAATMRQARGSAARAFVLLPGGLLPLPSSAAPLAEWEEIGKLLPERPLLDTLDEALAGPLPFFLRARLVTDFLPTAGELSRLATLAERAHIPLRIDTPSTGAPGRGLIASYSWRAGTGGEDFSFELLFDAAVAEEEGRLSVAAIAQGAKQGSTTLWRGSGRDLPKDRVLRLSTPKRGLEALVVEFQGPRGLEVRRLLVPLEREDRAKVLVIGSRTGKSFVESLYNVERVDLAGAMGRNLADYELVVLDGLPLASLGAGLGRRLAELADKRLASLLFVADSPEFGTQGDNPELERLLPVSLLPRSLKDLPDMAILILLDYSGSMFGGKLSLAKVASLELLKGLKAGDRVGLLLFSDKRRWVWNFEANSEIVAAPELEPVEAEGGTELGAALEEGLARLEKNPMREKHIVVISDGVTRPADFPALAARARAAGITISTMGIGEDLDRPLMEKLALQSKGRFYRVESANEIPSLIFEDRKSEARPPFTQGSIAVLDLGGRRVATIGGMAQYAARPGSSLLFTNEYGDPLFAGFEAGNRAVLLFASDIHGTYTADFFSKPAIVTSLRDRLDALFSTRPLEISLLETAREARIILRSEDLVSPTLYLSGVGREARELTLEKTALDSWEAELILPLEGPWHASLRDRGSALTSFDLALNPGLDGVESSAAAALAIWKPSSWRRGEAESLWLLLFFLSSLGATLVLRVRR